MLWSVKFSRTDKDIFITAAQVRDILFFISLHNDPVKSTSTKQDLVSLKFLYFTCNNELVYFYKK